MFSKLFVTVLIAVSLADLITACQPTSPSGSSAAPTTTTTAAPGRKRRSVDGATIMLHTNVQINNVGVVFQKLRNVASNLDLDVSKYGHVEHQISSTPNGTAIITLHLQNESECAGIRQTTQMIVKQVAEITSVSINCGGNTFTV